MEVGNEASKFALKPGNSLAIQKNFNSLKVGSSTLVPAITTEWQDIYISTSSLNGGNNQPNLQIIGIGTATIYIDAIYMTNTLPA
jgi:hypothetical protein